MKMKKVKVKIILVFYSILPLTSTQVKVSIFYTKCILTVQFKGALFLYLLYAISKFQLHVDLYLGKNRGNDGDLLFIFYIHHDMSRNTAGDTGNVGQPCCLPATRR